MSVRRLTVTFLAAAALFLGACGIATNNNGNSGGEGASCATTEELTDISEDRTLPSGTCYETAGFAVQEAVLTIEPGVTIRFREDAALLLVGGSELHVQGTADEKVLFTGTEEQRGWWSGIGKENDRTARLEISHAIIEYGGGKDSFGNISLETCCGAAAKLKLDNSTLRESATWGFRANEEGLDIESFENNTITKNTEGAITLAARDISAIVASNQLGGNDADFVQVDGGINEEVTFAALDVPYLVPNQLTIQQEGVVTVEAGAEFVFEQDAGILVGDWDSAGGQFTAIGSADNKIIFRGKEDVAGFWDGISFDGTQSLANTLEHVVVSGGGGADDAGNVSFAGCCGKTPTATLNNLTVEKCGEGGGIYVGDVDDYRIQGCNDLKANDCDPAASDGGNSGDISWFKSTHCE